MEEENKTEETTENILLKTKSEVEKIIKQITESGIHGEDVDLLYRLIDIHKDIENECYWKEELEMYRDDTYYMDNTYGRRMRDSKGRYMENSYGRRDRGRYRGYDMIEEMGEHYGNYSEGRDNYGNDRETEKSFDKMLQSLEDFTYLIMQEADSQDKIEKVRRTARKISEF